MKKILVVDDDRLICWTISRALAPCNVAVRCASGVHEAIALVATERFDLVLLDINLPDGNGLDLVGTIRAMDPGVQVIILSGDASDGNRERARASGALRFIEKPFENDQIVSAAEKLLAGAD